MRFKYVIASLGLALAMGVGVATGLSGQKEFKAAKAYVTTAEWGDNTYLRGGMNSWGASLLEYNSTSGRYEYSFTAASAGIEFKITDNDSWSGKDIGSNWLEGNGFNQSNFLDYVEAGSGTNIRLKQDGEYIFYWNKGTTASNVCADFGFERSEIAVHEPHTYTLVGTKIENAWDPTDTDYDFAMSNGNKTATYTADFVSGQQFKICEDHAWTVSYGYTDGNTVAAEVANYGGNFYVKTSGNYTITLTTNENYQKTNLTVVKNSQTAYRAYSLAGTFSAEDWDVYDTSLELSYAPGNKIASVTASFVEGDMFKVVTDHAWTTAYGYAANRVDASASYLIEESASDSNFEVKVAGRYTITVNLTNEYAFDSMLVSAADTYSVTFGGSKTTSLTLTSKGDYDAQWTGTVNVAANDTIAFKLNGEAIAATADVVYNNNYNAITGRVLSTASSVAVYLKLHNTGDFTYWIAGREAEYYVVVNGSIACAMSENPSNAGEYMATSVVLAKDDVVRFYNTAVFDATVNGGSTGTWTYNEGHIVCGTAGTYNVYMTPSGGGNTVYFGAPSLADAEATTFAETFLTAFQKTGENPGGICVSDGSTNTATLKAKWNGDDIAGAYDDLSDEAQGILTAASTSGSAKVNDFARLYNYIYNKYQVVGSIGLDDFAGRFATPTAVSLTPVSNNTTNVSIILVIVSSLVLLSIGGYFFIRKRKENN